MIFAQIVLCYFLHLPVNTLIKAPQTDTDKDSSHVSLNGLKGKHCNVQKCDSLTKLRRHLVSHKLL